MKKLLLASLVIVLLATVGGVLLIGRASATTAFASEQIVLQYGQQYAQQHLDEDCQIEAAYRTSSLREYTRGGYSLNDIRQMVGQQSLRQYKRVHTYCGGVITCELPFDYNQANSVFSTNDSIMPLNTFSYTRERIYGVGRPLASSIVVVLMGDGYTQAQQADFMNHAKSARDFMLGMHPFSLFRNRFVFYAVQTPSTQTWVRTPENTTNRFRTYEPSSNRISLPDWGFNQALDVTDWAVGGRANWDMTQIIANTTRFGGVARTWMHMTNLVTGVSVTTRHTNNGGWHHTFVHEFGHSFGSLADERNGVTGAERPNMTANAATARWNHWIGHGDIGQPVAITATGGAQWFVARGVTRNWLGTITGGCLMAYSHRNLTSFSAVSSAELTRRMAHIAGETFQSRHPNPGQTAAPNNIHVTMPASASRVVAYAFNGNTHLQEIRLGSGISHIGRYSFLGATGLRRIFVNSTFPPTVISTAFAGINANNVTVFVPVGTGARYRATAGWSQFTIVEKYTTTVLADGSVSLNSVNYPMGAEYVIPDRIPHITFPTENSASLSQRPVTQIGPSAFAENTLLAKITIPSTITYISSSAFTNTANTTFLFSDNTVVYDSSRGEAYIVSGGAPIFVADWNRAGGWRMPVWITRAMLNAMPLHPYDGTLVYDGRTLFVFAGGAAFQVFDFNDIGGWRPSVRIDGAVLGINHETGPFRHVRRRPLDGTLVSAAGQTYIFMSGVPRVATVGEISSGLASGSVITAVSFHALRNMGLG